MPILKGFFCCSCRFYIAILDTSHYCNVYAISIRRNKLSKKQIALTLQEATGVSGARANDAAGSVLALITEVLKSDGEFALPGVGTLRVRETKARDARNPKTGDVIHVPAGRTVRFKVSSVLKKEI